MASQFEQKLKIEHGIDLDKLEQACSILPKNYSFEIPKTICRILDAKKDLQKNQPELQRKKYKVSLQFPEGLLLFATLISDIIQKFCGSGDDEIECLILGDVTYGACCVDDLASKALECDFIVHYGHSCLVPIQDLTIKNALYVFVEISIDLDHFVQTVVFNFKSSDPLYLMGVIQFNKTIFVAKNILEQEPYNFTSLAIPQTKPRSHGEVLGCTSPAIPDSGSAQQSVVFISDGRFHIESTMIKNPHMKFFQYNPYSKHMTEEVYVHEQMHTIRRAEVEKAKKAQMFGIIFGTLGRQGNQSLLKEIENLLRKHHKQFFVLFLSEISIDKLKRFKKVEAWIQIACPRLSVDWGHHFEKPLLNTYEAFTCMNEIEWQQIYPMDYYSYDGGKWANYFKQEEDRKTRLAAKKKPAETQFPTKPNKKNESAFKSGMVMEHAVRPKRGVFQNKTISNIFFDPSGIQQSVHSERSLSKSKRYSVNSLSQTQRDPIKGVNVASEDQQSGRKLVNFQPSKQYDLLNKKRYMMHSEMKPLKELQNTKKYQMAEKRLKSSIFDNIQQQISQGNQTERNRSRGKGLEKQCSMDAILSYKDSLQYRDIKVQSKINQESYSDIQRNTVQSIQEQMTQPRMTKAAELKSSIF